MFRKYMGLTVLLAIAASAASCFGAEDISRRQALMFLTSNNKELSAEQEKVIARYLSVRISDYVEILKALPEEAHTIRMGAISEDAGSGTDTIDFVISSQEGALLLLDWFSANDRNPDARTWATVTEQLAVSLPYMRELSQQNITDAEWSSEALFLLPMIFQKFIINKLDTL